ncbi:MAG: hypothetical protein IRZ32_09370 [Solirubrobacteraceae bacterium]|nr:hypothetical protein [Solirubrobacteraceae bacterium]
MALETRREDAQACVDFFGLLGFEQVDPPPTLVDIALWAERDGLQLHFLFKDDPVIPPIAHVAVICPDYEATQARLRDAGFEVREHEVHWGSPRCYVDDPAGHVVEIMRFPPGGAPPS